MKTITEFEEWLSGCDEATEARIRARVAFSLPPSVPFAWRCRKSSWERPGWVITTLSKQTEDYDIVEPLYTTPTPALAPQDGVRAAAQAVMDAPNTSALWEAVEALRPILATPCEPDLLPGLKRAMDLFPHDSAPGNMIDVEIARIEKERQS